MKPAQYSFPFFPTIMINKKDSSQYCGVRFKILYVVVYTCTLHAWLLEYDTDLVHVILLQQCIKPCVE